MPSRASLVRELDLWLRISNIHDSEAFQMALMCADLREFKRSINGALPTSVQRAYDRASRRHRTAYYNLMDAKEEITRIRRKIALHDQHAANADY